MADRGASRERAATKLIVVARSVILLAVLVGAVPMAMVFAARERFGGGAPFHGVPSPADWRADRIRAALTDRLTEETIADVVIRLTLVVVWVAVVVIVVTVVAEIVHMIRHDGLAMPDIRGLGTTQRTARLIASGLIVVVPLFTSSSRAVAIDAPPGPLERPGMSAPSLERAGSAAASSADDTRRGSTVLRTEPSAGDGDGRHDTDAVASPAGRYVVRAGDSVYGIAERLVGPDSTRVAAFAERLVDINMGRQMPDGRRFDNTAFIDVGWVLELPGGGAPASIPNETGVHVVERGETLWSIADDELGDASRWPEVYGANEGRSFDDGRQLDDPDLIQPGWELRLPHEGPDGSVADNPVDPDPDPDPDLDPDLDLDLDPGPDSGPNVAAEPASGDAAPAALDRGIAVRDEATSSFDRDPLDEVDDGADTVDGGVEAADDAAGSTGRVNIWDEIGTDATAAARAPGPDVGVAGPDEAASESVAPRLLPLGAAAMLSAGVLTLLAVRRRTQLRRTRPRAVLSEPSAQPSATERALRCIDVGERFARVEIAIRAVAMPLVDRGARVLAVFVTPEGGVELRATGPVVLPAPWEGGDAVWHLAASTPLELLADDARPVSPPCPTLVQLGTDDDGRDVYVDLEAVTAIEVGGPGDRADAIVSAIAATLSASVLAEVTTLVGLGIADEAFLGHRRFVPVSDGRQAFEVSAAAIGSTASAGDSTFQLRATGTASETWEPAVVLIGSSAGSVTVPGRRTGLAVVSASPLHGPSSRLAPDGEAWLLQPAGIRLTPVGLTESDIAAIAELVTVVDAEPDPAARSGSRRAASTELDRAGLDDHTFITGPHERNVHAVGDDQPATHDDHRAVVADAASRAAAPVPPPPHELLVRMIGPVAVVDGNGVEVAFERSKTRELVAWLATHRARSTRSAARTALWELDVRDATFANVVSEARRSLARLVEPPEGEEWVGRTMTDSLPLHHLVLSDVDALRHAVEAARLQPPVQAIATLAPAVDLIAGMPFEGTSYLWPDSEGITSDVVLLATTATTELAAHCLSIGDIEGVFRSTARGLQVLPAHEELIGIRMEAHARAGDHAGVRQEWESYERVINGDPWSDGEPAPKLIELRRRLLHPSR